MALHDNLHIVLETDRLFIRQAHRPDLRAAFATPIEVGEAAAGIASLPRPLRFSGCNEKEDKVDKNKEINKDDKSNRAPVRDRRPGDCSWLAGAQHLDAPPHDSIFS